MSRILKRPMFRKGGTPNEGIMSGLQEPRPGYATGVGPGLEQIIAGEKLKMSGKPYYTEPYIQNKFGDYTSRFFAKPTQDIDMAELGGYGFIEAPQSAEEAGIMKFIQTQPEEAYELFKKGELGGTDYSKKQAEQIKAAEEAGLGIDFKLPEIKTEPTEEPKPTLEGVTKKAPKSDAETIKEYMNMFKTALAGDEDEITRQKYLQLAQFGANILAQPGGDLVGAIGKAAAPSIAELSKIQSREKAAEREAKVLGLQAAIQRLDPTKLEETVKYLQREMPGVGTEKLINMAIAGSTGKAQTQESRIQANAEALTGEIGQAPALKAARSMEIIGRNYAEFSLLPVDKEGKIKPDTPDGLYYDKKGNLSIIDKGVKSDIKIGSK